MHYIIHYDIASLVIFLITSIIFAFRKRIPCKRNKVFAMLLGIASASAVFDILSVLITSDMLGRNFKIFLHTAYYVTHNFIPFWFVIYIMFLTDTSSSVTNSFRIRLYLPEIVNILLIVTSPLTGWIIRIDSSGNYDRGPLQPICYAISIYYLALGIVYALETRRMMPRQAVLSVLSFIAMTLIAMFIHMINPALMVECFGSALCIMLVMFILQNQDDMIDSGTKMLNRSSFVNNCLANCTSGTQFSILLIRIPDFTLLMRTFGTRFSNTLLRNFADYLYSFIELGEGYYLEDECFALTYFRDGGRVGEVYREIFTRLGESWKIGSVDTLISAYFLRIDVPKDAEDTEIIMDYVEHFKRMKSVPDHMLHASEINIYDQRRREEVEKAIERGIENRSFSVYYQPIYSADKKRIVSCEALIRLVDDQLGNIPPDEFITLAEQNGMIIKIGRIVFEEACRFIKKGEAMDLGIQYVEVNLSVVQCMQSDLAEQFMSIMDQYKVDPSNICLEITETAAAYTPHIMEQNIRLLSDMGIKMALDDYGTGYSNMSYLLNMPFKFLKLDKGMMRAALERDKARIAIESTIVMAKKLNMQIIAEGIETDDQLERVLDMGCDFIQGNYFSMPVPGDEFLQVLKKFSGDEVKSHAN